MGRTFYGWDDDHFPDPSAPLQSKKVNVAGKIYTEIGPRKGPILISPGHFYPYILDPHT